MPTRKALWTAVACVMVSSSLLLVQTTSRRRLTSAETHNARPSIILDVSSWDFGTVSDDSELRAVFSIRNAGERRLLLFERSRSCGCLSSGQREVIVNPGDSTNLTVLLRTSRLRGPVQKHVQYETNDPNKPTLTLTLLANVECPSTRRDEPNVGHVAAQ